MKKLILGISAMISGVLLICAALIAGGEVANGARSHSGGDYDIADSGIAVIFMVIGSIIVILGLILSVTEVFRKSNNLNND